ncbi:response regulator [Methylorubrum sp. SB2]|uniref:response regulator n=1 Tax=Methylorubrum subtropicum TaxID=3138812 RepID=UPI00313D33AC
MSSLPPPSAESEPTAEEPGLRTGLSILLVEDDTSSQELIRALCERRGDRVEIAADGFQGLRRLAEGEHDVALIDYHLPEMDGYALARLMKELSRPAGRLRLVGITADRHGLAARRGADRLFDAILVKPLRPADLFGTLDRLSRRDSPAAPSAPADELWARRGLKARPAALLLSDTAAGPAEALSQAFRIVSDAGEADIALVADETGLAALRSLRASGPQNLLPSVALSERLGPACDLVFQVGDPEAWTAVAQAGRGFRERRAALPPEAAPDAAARLLRLLVVADRGLILNRDAADLAYETGDSPAGRMAAVLALAQAGLVRCEPCPQGMLVAVTEAGRAGLLSRPPGAPEHSKKTSGWAPPSVKGGPPAGRAWSAPGVTERAADPETMAELGRLIGTDHVERLRGRLIAMLETSFAPDADAATLARQAHILISAAGSLGFEPLAARCRALETAIRAHRDYREELRLVRSAAQAVAGRAATAL